MKIIKYFIGGAVAGVICMFFIKLYFETQWRSDDIQTIKYLIIFINYDLFSRASFINRLIQNSVKKKAGKNNKSIIK